VSTARSRMFVLGALLAAAVFVGARFAGPEGAGFAVFALLTVGGAAACLFARSTVQSARALLATILGTSGLFLLLESDLLAVAQVLVFSGGVLALILFGAKLVPEDPSERKLSRILGALLLVLPLCAVVAWHASSWGAFVLEQPSPAKRDELIGADWFPPEATSDAGRIGVALLDPKQYAVALEFAALLLAVALVAANAVARKREKDA